MEYTPPVYTHNPPMEFALPLPVIPPSQLEYVEYRVWVPWVKHEWWSNNGVMNFRTTTSQVNPVIRKVPHPLPPVGWLQGEEIYRDCYRCHPLERLDDIARFKKMRESFTNSLKSTSFN